MRTRPWSPSGARGGARPSGRIGRAAPRGRPHRTLPVATARPDTRVEIKLQAPHAIVASNLTHWLISTQPETSPNLAFSMAPCCECDQRLSIASGWA